MPPELSSALVELCREYRVSELALFGSMSRGDQSADSDINLLVEFEPQARIGFLTLSRLSRELSILMCRPVDLVPKAGLKASIRDQVPAEAKIIYAS